MKEITIGAGEAGQRLDKFLDRYLGLAGKSFLYKMLRKKNIVVNGKKADGALRLSAGDRVILYLSEETIGRFTRETETPDRLPPLTVIYEDADMIAVDKPAGLLSQKARPEDVSLCEMIVAYLIRTGQRTAEDDRFFRPGVCNRLDRNTSGLVLAGKNLHAQQQLSEIIRSRAAGKYYLAAVCGDFRGSLQLKAYLEKEEAGNKVTVRADAFPGSEMIETGYEPLARGNGYTLLKVELVTGKTHQIRAHLAFLGYPIAGDPKYGDTARNRALAADCGLHRQLLHAWQLQLPGTAGLAGNGKKLTAPLPADFRRFLQKQGLELPET